MGHSGAEWLTRQFRTLVVSEHGRRVADVLGDVYNGLYHLDDNALFHKRTRWNDDRLIEIVVRGRLTHSHLIVLTEMCKRHNIHVEIDGASNGFVQLLFFAEL